MLSDCSGAHWWNGQASQALGLWARQAATAVLQPLPERLWRRTAMPSVPGLACLMTAGAPNSELVFSPYDSAAGAGVPVPVLEISSDWLADWARLLRGPSSPVPMAAGYVPAGAFTRVRPLERERQLSIDERVARFQNTASPEAARLAACLAVSFPSLPVLRLLQHQLLGSRQPAHLAEVLLSGLLRPDDERRQTFRFVPGARESLLASMPRSESWYVADALSRISAEIEALADRTRESFEAFLQVPKGSGYTSVDADQPIALVSPDAVRYLRRSLVFAPPPREQPRQQTRPAEPAAPRPAPARARTAPPADVFVSYAPEDRPWAEWIEAILAESGLRPLRRSTVHTVDDQVREMESASLLIAVLSPAFIRSPAARRVWDAAVAGLERTRRRLLPIRLAETRLPSTFADFSPLDLYGLDAGQATAALHRALAGLGGSSPRPSAPDSDRARFPGGVPSVWNVPTRNVRFTGHDTLIETLRDQLTSDNPVVLVPKVLHGLGGVGKTQVCIEYAHRFMSGYDVVWWVPSDAPELISGSLADLAARLGIQVAGSIAEAAAAAVEALRRGSPYHRWLIVFDNADDPRDLRAYLPEGPGHVLVTSRNPAWSQVATTLGVDTFRRADSVAYLLRVAPGLTDGDADRVAAALGDLPLALQQAGAWLEQTAMPAATYLELLEREGARILDMSGPVDYPATMATAWRLSFERLREQSPAAGRLLELCAFFAPEPISLQLLTSREMAGSLSPLDSRLHNPGLMGQLIRDIARFALATVDQANNSIRVHRLIQAFIREQMTQEQRDAARHEVHRVLAGARPRQGGTDDPENWARFDLIWPHLEPSRAGDCDEAQTRELLIDRVRYLWQRGEFESALEYGRRIEQQWRQMLGGDHRQTLYLRFQLANALRSLGRYSEAYTEDSEVFQTQREVLGDEHPHTLYTAGALAGDLRALGEYPRALDLNRQTRERFTELFGEDHPSTLAAASNLAADLRLAGDCFKARELDQDTLARRQAALGPDHPYTLGSAANLARDMRQCGDFGTSVELLRHTCERYTEVLGEDSVDTLRTATSLAVSLRKAGQFDEAQLLLTRARVRYARDYPADFPDSLGCALSLACVLSALRDHSTARDLALDVTGTYERMLGAGHPNALVAANNAAIYLRRSREAPRARAMLERAHDGLRTRLGDDHPHSLACAVNLANCLSDLGEHDRTGELQRRTHARLGDTLGDTHPDTLICAANIAVSLQGSGRHGEARELRRQVLSSLEPIVGNGHPAAEALRQWQLQDAELEPLL